MLTIIQPYLARVKCANIGAYKCYHILRQQAVKSANLEKNCKEVCVALCCGDSLSQERNFKGETLFGDTFDDLILDIPNIN